MISSLSLIADEVAVVLFRAEGVILSTGTLLHIEFCPRTQLPPKVFFGLAEERVYGFY